jgi:hypothetical protein
MRTAIIQVYDPSSCDRIDSFDKSFLILEKLPDGGVKIIGDYEFDMRKMSFHDMLEILDSKLYKKGFDNIFIENTRFGKIIPLSEIKNARYKEIHEFQNQLKKDFGLKCEHARLFSNKIFTDKDLNRPYNYKTDPREEFDRKRNALFMNEPEKYSKMLRKKKKIVKPKTKRKCRCK